MSSLIAARDTYVLRRRFDMPHGNGTIDAWAVSSSQGIIIISFYTIMMKAIVTYFWMAVVLFGVGLFLQRHSPHDSDSSATTTTIGLWNFRHSPQQVIYFMIRRAFAVRTSRDLWYPLIWFAVAAVALAASLVVPILKTQSLKIGNVAPVNPKSVFVPYYFDPNSDMLETAQQMVLAVPAAMRAVGAAGTIPANTVFISNATSSSENGTVFQLDYRYGISGSDFGLQKTPDLWLNVSGSCITDYTWYQYEDESGGDVYHMFNDPSNVQVVYPSLDHGPAFATAYVDARDGYISISNISYALLVSSVGRQSLSNSTDPWYATENIVNNNPPWLYQVKNERPPLSCREETVWSYRGHTNDTLHLRELTDNRLSKPVYIALSQNLYNPMVTLMTDRIGRSSLASSTTYVQSGFDAKQCSVIADMTRLINTSYIATRNILSDSTTMSVQGRGDLLNVFSAFSANNSGSDEFVISSPDIITLSVKALIIVPTVFVGVIVLLVVLAFLPDPWRSSKELNATRLHALKRQNAKTKTRDLRESKGNENGRQDDRRDANENDGGNVGKEVHNIVTSINA
ncbi:hypothetical protein TSTA_073100 [Talaromyces stipitatus ATCC 10500]|uniref:Uncharacterized protein n=1 Tax=Talaromyces stipitatus (strain ATCC 10500 / CBS 375.48 / QM 6759 / NRRL 1006) TaxID=441959 RepID=B8LUR3_TALSN|nr:uncharacterized protein TSTA_073100 [Talaromyces stipitatus ATCC 10500]EED23920.1 hypothetical protein TSTA_073100 [Talaromyces stipitatus ATCC 10500]